MCFNGFPVIFSLCFVSYDQQFIIFIVVLWYMTLLYTFGSFGWEFWVQLATEGVLPMRFCGPLFCQACWLFYFSKDEVIRESTAKLPAGCSSVYQVRILNFRFFFFCKTKLYGLCFAYNQACHRLTRLHTGASNTRFC